MPNIVRIVEYKNRELIEFLEELTEKAKKGEVTGVAAAIKINEWHHGMVLLGDYSSNPGTASTVVGRLFTSINKRIEELGLYTIVEEDE
jgi:ribosomal protein L17